LIRRISIAAFLLFCVLASHTAQAQARTRNVVLIVSDGLRWQEIFTGADPTLLNEKDGGIWESAETLRGKYWSDDPTERRRKLFPFLWDVVARQGQMYGNRNLGSIAQVTNPYAFSYPGYNEMITGKGDPRIDKNDFGPNPNINVFEWLNRQPDLVGQVHVYGTWDTFRDIFNQKRSGLPVSAGWTITPSTGTSDGDKLYAQLLATATRFDDEDLDNALLVSDHLKTYFSEPLPAVSESPFVASF